MRVGVAEIYQQPITHVSSDVSVVLLDGFPRRRLIGSQHLAVSRRVYVLAAGFDHPGTKAAYESVKKSSGWTSEIMQGGHDLMIDNPEAVTKVLLAQA